MGASKKEPGVLLRLPQELYERVVVWSSETGRTINDLLLDAVQRSFLAAPEERPRSSDTLQQENEALKRQVALLTEALRSYYPEEQPTPKPPPRRVSPEEQKRALLEAQKRLESLRAQQKRQPVQLPTPKGKELSGLQTVERDVRQVATEMLSPRSETMSQQRALTQRGRVEGVAYEESEEPNPRYSRREYSPPAPPHIKATLQKKAEEIVLAQRQSATHTEPAPQGRARKKS